MFKIDLNIGIVKRLNVSLFTISALLISMTSCVTQRNLEYLQYKVNDPLMYSEATIEEYRLKPKDELFIQISSLDDPNFNIFSGTAVQQQLYMSSMQPYGASMISYTVDKNGYVLLPVVGMLHVEDKTITEVSEIIKESLENILNQPVVTVKLVNRYVSILGEVYNPGHYTYSKDKLTIFDAIGMAGDIGEYGNRKEILITRNVDGKNNMINVDLTRPEILSSEYYYMQPNDIIYVKPLRKKFWGMRQFPFSIILSTITTGMLIINYFD